MPDRINLVEQSGEYDRGKGVPHEFYDFVCGHIAGGLEQPSFRWEVKVCDRKRVLFCSDCVGRYDAGAELVVRGHPQPRKPAK
jgi:hypothetical protein